MPSVAIFIVLSVLNSYLLVSFSNSYELVLPPDGEYGRDIGNGSWTGVVGMLQNRVSPLYTHTHTHTHTHMMYVLCSVHCVL